MYLKRAKIGGVHAGALYGMVVEDHQDLALEEPCLVTCGKDGRVCVVSAWQFCNLFSTRGDEKIRELMMFPRLAADKPAWGESFCLAGAHIVCGARDGRLMAFPRASVAKRRMAVKRNLRFEGSLQRRRLNCK